MIIRIDDVSAYVDAPEPRLSRRARLLADPKRRAGLEQARRRVAAEVSDSGAFSLAKLRLQAGLSQSDLATLMATQQPAIARLERGDSDPSLSTLQKLANALGQNVETVIKAFEFSKTPVEQ